MNKNNHPTYKEAFHKHMFNFDLLFKYGKFVLIWSAFALVAGLIAEVIR